MTAAAVKAIMGEPAEVQPGPPSSGKTEIWIYRRSTYGVVRQIQTGTRSETTNYRGADMMDRAAQSVAVPIYVREVDKTTETISLLMIDGSFIVQKHSAVIQKEYQ